MVLYILWYIKSKEGAEQHRKQECLKVAINKGKVLGDQKHLRHEKVNKTSDETINRIYAKY